MGALLATCVAVSLYLVWVLEIIKLRRLREWQLRRADPDTSEHDIDEAVDHEFGDRGVRPGLIGNCAANRTSAITRAEPLPFRKTRSTPGLTSEEVSRTVKTTYAISLRQPAYHARLRRRDAVTSPPCSHRTIDRRSRAVHLPPATSLEQPEVFQRPRVRAAPFTSTGATKCIRSTRPSWVTSSPQSAPAGPEIRAVKPQRPERPPSAPLRGSGGLPRAAWRAAWTTRWPAAPSSERRRSPKGSRR